MHEIFISYSHADKEWKERIAVFLRCVRLHRRVGFRAWSDDDIRIGERFESTIREAIDRAQVALLLVSPDFMASEFVNVKELAWMRERSQDGLLAVSPILIRPSPLSLDPWLSSLQFHPDDKRALSTMQAHEVDAALTELTDEIDRLLIEDDDVATADDEPPDAERSDDTTQTSTTTRPKTTKPASDVGSAPGWSRLSRAELLAYLSDKTGQEPVDDLIIFRTKKQQTWLVATAGSLYCLLDDQRTQRNDRLIQWRQDVTGLPIPVGTRPSNRYEKLGLLDVGAKQNWLYTKSRFENPGELVSKVNLLIEAARGGATRHTGIGDT